MPTPTTTKRTDLAYKAGTSDKVYHVWVENVGANWFVKFRYGRRGSTLTDGTKVGPTDTASAMRVYETVVTEKLAKGYKPIPKPEIKSSPAFRAAMAAVKKPVSLGTAAADVTAGDPVMVMGVAGSSGASFKTTETKGGKKVTATWTLGDTTSCQLLNPIDETTLDTFITDDKWVMQEKHDGKRMLLGHPGDGSVEAWNRKGQSIVAPEEYCSALQSCFEGFKFIIDGEACGDKYWVFDILWLEGLDCRKLPYHERLVNLGMLIRSAKPQDVIRQVMSADTTMQKKSLLRAVKSAGREGVAIKDKDCPYTAGRPNSFGPALKFKFVESATVVVTAHSDKRSVFMAMLEKEDSKKMVDVGKVTIPANHDIPPLNSVVEVQYLYAYKGGSLYQPVYKGRRDDVPVDTLDKLKYKPGEMPAEVVRGKFEDLTQEIVDTINAQDAVSKGEVAVKAPGLAIDKKYFRLEDGRMIKLLTPLQLEAMPKGTLLFDVCGDPAVVGDDLDDDVRGGFTAYGIEIPMVDKTKSLGAWGDAVTELKGRSGEDFEEFVESIVDEIIPKKSATESMAKRMEREYRAKQRGNTRRRTSSTSSTRSTSNG